MTQFVNHYLIPFECSDADELVIPFIWKASELISEIINSMSYTYMMYDYVIASVQSGRYIPTGCMNPHMLIIINGFEYVYSGDLVIKKDRDYIERLMR